MDDLLDATTSAKVDEVVQLRSRPVGGNNNAVRRQTPTSSSSAGNVFSAPLPPPNPSHSAVFESVESDAGGADADAAPIPPPPLPALPSAPAPATPGTAGAAGLFLSVRRPDMSDYNPFALSPQASLPTATHLNDRHILTHIHVSIK